MVHAETTRARAISWPREHGGYVTLAGVAIVAVGVAPDAFAAVGVVMVMVAAFLARAPLERRSVDLPLRRADPAALVVFGALAILGTWLAARRETWLAGAAVVAGAAVTCGALWARRTRLHRSAAFEAVALAGLGASSGLAALAGGATPRAAAVIALVLAVHAGLSVPLVRSSLRKGNREAAHAPRLFTVLVATVAGLVALGAAPAALALTPRVIQVARLPKGPATAGTAGFVETVVLALAVVVLVLAV